MRRLKFFSAVLVNHEIFYLLITFDLLNLDIVWKTEILDDLPSRAFFHLRQGVGEAIMCHGLGYLIFKITLGWPNYHKIVKKTDFVRWDV